MKNHTKVYLKGMGYDTTDAYYNKCNNMWLFRYGGDLESHT